MSALASAFGFILAVVVLGFALRAVTRRKPSPPPVRSAEIRPLRCGCDPKTEHPQLGSWPIPCTDEDADWWFASEDEGDCCVWQRRFNSRAEAEQALTERGWKSSEQWLPASAGEAGTAETAQTDSVHEHAVGEAETPNLSSPSQGEGE